MAPAPTGAIDVVHDAVDDLSGTAVVAAAGQAPLTMRSGAGDITVGVPASGVASVQVSIRDHAGDLVLVSGPAAPPGRPDVSDHVVILLRKAGLFADTAKGDTCTAGFTTVTEQRLVGVLKCVAVVGSDRVPVTVRLSAG